MSAIGPARALTRERLALQRQLTTLSELEEAYGGMPDLRRWLSARLDGEHLALSAEERATAPSLAGVAAARHETIVETREVIERVLEGRAARESSALLARKGGQLDREAGPLLGAGFRPADLAFLLVDRRSPGLPAHLCESDVHVGTREAIATLVRPLSELVAEAILLLEQEAESPVVVLTFGRVLLAGHRIGGGRAEP